ncbi:MAG: L-aspartate oxidase [Planctomycetota bacterium]
MKIPTEYLISFDTAKLSSFITDVLVIGSGAAGLRAAIESAQCHNVTVVSKDSLSESNTYYAQGGIASQIDKPNSLSSHITDTLINAHGLSDRYIVKKIIRKGITLVNELISWGMDFDKKNNRFNMTQEGGHRSPRILHSGGDATGKYLQETLLRKIKSLNNITTFDYTFIIDILTSSDDRPNQLNKPGLTGDRKPGLGRKECYGAIAHNQKTHKTFIIWAKKTIIASGGAGQLYRETTNPDITTGDSISIAYRKGAQLQDLEFFQFHPTALYVAGASRFLISEAVRGEGGILRDKYGKRFMYDYHPQMELAPRDVVSRAIINQMKISQDTNVYLDLTHLPTDKIKKRFPHLRKLCRNFDIDIRKDMIPVRPSAHYLIGGIKINISGQTNIKNLFAAGECASSSFHGANRLGSNSLLEALVIGYFSGHYASNEIKSSKPFSPKRIKYLPYWSSDQASKRNSNFLSSSQRRRFNVDLTDIKNSLRSLMWYNVGLERNATGLKQALSKIDYWSGYCLTQEFSTPADWEIQNMLILARLLTLSALKRTESRGVHYRTDFPETSPKWKRHSII